jgi:hypothetical protein
MARNTLIPNPIFPSDGERNVHYRQEAVNLLH